ISISQQQLRRSIPHEGSVWKSAWACAGAGSRSYQISVSEISTTIPDKEYDGNHEECQDINLDVRARKIAKAAESESLIAQAITLVIRRVTVGRSESLISQTIDIHLSASCVSLHS